MNITTPFIKQRFTEQQLLYLPAVPIIAANMLAFDIHNDPTKWPETNPAGSIAALIASEVYDQYPNITKRIELLRTVAPHRLAVPIGIVLLSLFDICQIVPGDAPPHEPSQAELAMHKVTSGVITALIADDPQTFALLAPLALLNIRKHPAIAILSFYTDVVWAAAAYHGARVPEEWKDELSSFIDDTIVAAQRMIASLNSLVKETSNG